MRSAVWFGLLAACGASHARPPAETTGWDCHDRTVSYVAAHAIAAAEVGVEMDCAHGPRIKRWQVDAATNQRHETSRAMTPSEFDTVWAQLAGIGWENLKDCKHGDGGKSAPLYQFDVKDDQNTASFSCQSLHVPYPYNDLVDPLDAAAAQGASE